MVLEARNSESRFMPCRCCTKDFYDAEADHIINTRAYITDLVHKLMTLTEFTPRELELSLHVDDIELDIDKLCLSLIIQETVCNAFNMLSTQPILN